METLTFNFNFDGNGSLSFGFYVEQHRELYDVLSFHNGYINVFTKDYNNTYSFRMGANTEAANMFFLPGTFVVENNPYELNYKPLRLDKMFAFFYRPIRDNNYSSYTDVYMTYKKDGEVKSTQIRNGDFTVDIDPLFPSAQIPKLTSNRLN